MADQDLLEKRFRNRMQSGPISYSVEMRERGLVLGAGTCLARMTGDATRPRGLEFAKDAERIVALLSIAGAPRNGIDSFQCIKAASDDWERGDKALANIRLAQATLPRVVDAADAYRLFLAEELLDQGTSPRALMKALGFDTAALDLIRYDPNQPRVPAGNGRESGRWGSGGEGNAASGADRSNGHGSSVTYAFAPPAATETAVARTFLAGASSETIGALATFAARFSVPTAVLGALFIPTPNSGGVIEGTLPDEPNIRFKKDGPEGTLRITTKAVDGSDVFVIAHNSGGLYIDAKTDQPIGRDLGE